MSGLAPPPPSGHPEKTPRSVPTLAHVPPQFLSPVIRRRSRLRCPPWLKCRVCFCPQSSGEDPAFSVHLGSSATFLFLSPVIRRRSRLQCPPWLTCHVCSCPQSRPSRSRRAERRLGARGRGRAAGVARADAGARRPPAGDPPSCPPAACPPT